MKILLVPLDDRPVSYLLPQLVAHLAGLDAVIPPRELFGALLRPAQPDALQQWIESALKINHFDAAFVCADVLIYGGLINSRRGNESISELENRLKIINSWRKKMGNIPFYLQASIMRISDNHDNTEEKEYWSRYGREIFAWSENLHRSIAQDSIAAGLLRESERRIPDAIRHDYLNTRYRNFRVNLALLDALNKGCFSRVVFSLDDSGENGLNVLEREKLEKRIQQLNLSHCASSYAGADEVLCSMIAHWLATNDKEKRTVANLVYALPAAEFCPSRYEGQSIGNSVRSQLNSCGIKLKESDGQDELGADFTVIVHAGENGQGDHILLPGHQDMRSIDTREAVAATIEHLRKSKTPCVLCDVAYANGSDPGLIARLIEEPDLFKKLWAYSGWNTTGNAVGAALAMAVARLHSQASTNLDELVKESLFLRLADDWAYQTQARRNLKTPSVTALIDEMRPLLSQLSNALGCSQDSLHFAFPWQRLFEIEITSPHTRAFAGAKAD